MQLFGPTGSRNFPTDRNPTRIAVGAFAGVVGGASTTFATYTVPAGRRCTIWSATVNGVVITVLAAGQTSEQIIRVTKPGPILTEQVHDIIQAAAAVGTRVQHDKSTIELAAGDILDVIVSVTAGAGVVQAGGGLSGVEYDA